MRHLSLTAIAIALTGAVALAKPPDGSGPAMRWAHSWKEAQEEAKTRNVPIMFAFHKDD